MSIQMTLKHVFGVQKRERYNENLRMKKNMISHMTQSAISIQEQTITESCRQRQKNHFLVRQRTNLV